MRNRLAILAVIVLALIFVVSVGYMQAKSTTATSSTTISEDKPCPKDGAKCCPAKDECKNTKGECKDGKAGCCDKAKETKKSCPGTACKGSACEQACPKHGDKK